MYFHERLIELRRQNGWSQEELGNKLNVSRQTVSKWELGLTTPDMNNLQEMSAIFDISLDELINNKSADYKRHTSNLSNRGRYEYKSKAHIGNLPLVHVNIGPGMYKAKGIIAVGNIATGIISFGLISFGIISFGIIAFGLLLALGCLSVGILSCGAIALGVLAIGGLSFGYLSIGGASFGAYAVGGYASAKHIALGGFADATIAIGERAHGTYTILTNESGEIDITMQEFEKVVSDYLPKTSQAMTKFFLKFFK